MQVPACLYHYVRDHQYFVTAIFLDQFRPTIFWIDFLLLLSPKYNFFMGGLETAGHPTTWIQKPYPYRWGGVFQPLPDIFVCCFQWQVYVSSRVFDFSWILNMNFFLAKFEYKFLNPIPLGRGVKKGGYLKKWSYHIIHNLFHGA